MSDTTSATKTNDAQQVFEAIREFLNRTSALAAEQEITLDTPLLEGGALDSLGIMQLVVFVGEEFGIEVTDEDFAPENFETVGTLVAFANAKKSNTA